MASTQNSTADFPVSKIILSFPTLSCFFPQKFLVRNVAFTPWKKASSLRKFKMAMKQPTLPSFHFKRLSNDQDKPSPSTSAKNTNAYSSSIPDPHGPRKTLMFHINDTTD